MGRRLGTAVAVQDPTTLSTKVLLAGEEVPSWAESQITNEAVYEQAAAADSAGGSGDEGGGAGGDTQEPPRAGAGSGKEEWLAYATNVLKLKVDPEAKRDDIIAAVDAAKQD